MQVKVQPVARRKAVKTEYLPNGAVLLLVNAWLCRRHRNAMRKRTVSSAASLSAAPSASMASPLAFHW